MQCVHRKFSYESRVDRILKNWSTFAKVIITHQGAGFFGTLCIFTVHKSITTQYIFIEILKPFILHYN